MKTPETNKLESINSGERTEIKRRDFFKFLSGGIVVLAQPWNILDLEASSAQQRRTLTKDYNAFLHIAEDGTVTCFTGKIEMGQGPITALAQMMADELDVPMESVKMVMGNTDLCPYDEGTWGSTSVRAFGPSMRAAAAEARTVLLQLGSEQLGVPVSQLEVKNGIINDKTDIKKKVSYAQLTKGKKIERYLKEKPVLKDASKFNIIGKSFLHQDARLKVTGQAIYAGDIKIPGMLFARILRPPSHGAKLKSVDLSEAENIKGIQVVRDGDFIALLHESREIVDQAILKVKTDYTFNEMQVNDKTIFDHFKYMGKKANVIRTKGDIEAGRQSSEKVIESEFYNSYVAHAPMEPHVAAAKMEGDKITVWVSNQTPFPTQENISRELGLPLEKVCVITPFVGGGFGGKGANPQAVEVAKITKMTGKPVMLAWTRQEEFFYDTLRPAAVVKINSGIDKAGMITFWDFSVYYAGSRGSDTIYNVPNDKTTSYDQRGGDPPVHPYAVGPWRAPGNNTNTYARELQIALMASRAGMDPLEFRIKNLKDEKMVTVLKAVADKFGYTPAKSPSGRGIRRRRCSVHDVDRAAAVVVERCAAGTARRSPRP